MCSVHCAGRASPTQYLPIGTVITFWKPDVGTTRTAVVLEHFYGTPNNHNLVGRANGWSVRIVVFGQPIHYLWFDPKKIFFQMHTMPQQTFDHQQHLYSTAVKYSPWMVPRLEPDIPPDRFRSIRVNALLDFPVIGTGYVCKRRGLVIETQDSHRGLLLQIHFDDTYQQEWVDPVQALFFKVDDDDEVEVDVEEETAAAPPKICYNLRQTPQRAHNIERPR